MVPKQWNVYATGMFSVSLACILKKKVELATNSLR